jgi:hypothetical protein
MPKFKLRLTHTTPGANPHHKVPVEERRRKAIRVATHNHVTGPGGQPIENHITPETDGATWIVEGQEGHVDTMIRTWESKGNVNVVKTPI